MRPHLLTPFLVLSILTAPPAMSQDDSGPAGAQQQAAVQSVETMRARAIRFLRIMQAEDGSFSSQSPVGISGLVIQSLLRSGLPAEDPMVAKGLQCLESYRQPDGGIYPADSRHRNYETCIALMVFAEADRARYADDIRRAELFLRGLQWDAGEGIESSDPAWGGGGYGSHERPDLSNTQYLIEALHAAGVRDDDPAMQKILVFVSRTQNLESAANTTAHAAKINDGGFYYTPAAGGESKAGLTANGGLRSYGSMTYAGVKSLIYAGLTQEDPRVRAAVDWLRAHYTLNENPGVGQQGLFYYYHTIGKTMSVLGETQFRDADGQLHDWQSDIRAVLSAKQAANGSWVNPADRWYEGDPSLVTAYALLALSYCD